MWRRQRPGPDGLVYPELSLRTGEEEGLTGDNGIHSYWGTRFTVVYQRQRRHKEPIRVVSRSGTFTHKNYLIKRRRPDEGKSKKSKQLNFLQIPSTITLII